MVAIVGRPNVGKSTLFNRFVGGRKALVHEKPGMTRDRKIERVEWDNQAFLCVDTGGFDVALEDPLLENVAEQARIAIAEADAIIFLSAVGEESHPAEQAMIEILRRSKKPVVVAVNKCDNEKLDFQSQEFYRHGFDQVFPVSALHGRGVADVMDAVLEKLKRVEIPERDFASGGVAVAIVGRQNVGKSTLVNRLLGEKRVIVSDLPGTTRDAIDTIFKTPDGEPFTLIDTAGIRRRGRVEKGFEKLSVLSSLLAIQRADVAILVIDASAGVTAQDAHVAGYCVDEGRGLVILVNKWDIAEKDHRTADQFTKNLQRKLGFLQFAPILYGSALTGQRVSKLLEIVKRVYDNAGRKIPTPELNDNLKKWIHRRSPPVRYNRPPKIRYMTQIGSHPPCFAIFVNDPRIIHFSYRRYLVNCLREDYNFEGTPIRLVLRGTKDD